VYVIPPLALVTAVPPALQAATVHIAPLLPHVSNPLMVNVSVPARVALLNVIAPPTALPLVPLSVKAPPVIDSAFTKLAPPVTVRGPAVKLIFALLTKLAIVWFTAALMPAIVMVALEKVDPMQTVSLAAGNTPVSQFPTVVHSLSPAEPFQLMLPEQPNWASGSSPVIIATTPPEACAPAGLADFAFVAESGEPKCLSAAFSKLTEAAFGKSDDVVAPPRYAEPLPSMAMPLPWSVPAPPRKVENRSPVPLEFKTTRKASWHVPLPSL